MLTGFVKLSLLKGSAFMTVSNYRISFNKNVVARLLKPRFVTFLFNRSTNQFAIQKCDEFTDFKLPFFKDDSDLKNGVQISNRELFNFFINVMKWDLDHSNYRVDGIFNSNDQAMIFDLNSARLFKKRGV